MGNRFREERYSGRMSNNVIEFSPYDDKKAKKAFMNQLEIWVFFKTLTCILVIWQFLMEL